MSQKTDRAIGLIDEIKTALTHQLPQKERSSFAVMCENTKADFRKSLEGEYKSIATRFRTTVTPHLKRVGETTADTVKSALWRLDQAVGGRR